MNPKTERMRRIGILGGCTELPLASTGTDFESRCLDANHALAQALVRFALGARAA
jgi:aspartate/glutamate racemase